MGNRPVFLRLWQPNLSLLSKDLEKLLVWIILKGASLEYWTDYGLSILASRVGKPLYTDRRTMEKSRIDFARLCVEVDAANELIREFTILDTDGENIKVQVEYDWELEHCRLCKSFGHASTTCVIRKIDLM